MITSTTDTRVASPLIQGSVKGGAYENPPSIVKGTFKGRRNKNCGYTSVRLDRIMDSQLHSDSKFKSDFSIERILGEDSERSREEVPSPSWLCCTRYRPPRLTRTTSNACRARRSGRHARVPFTAAQASALEAAYARAPYLAPPALRALAAALQLRDDRIKIWFQNRRARERREKSTNISPPQAMTLPPTSPSNPALIPVQTSWSHIQSIHNRQKTTERDQSMNMPLQKYSITPPEISIQTSHTIVKSEDEEDRCDSPINVVT